MSDHKIQRLSKTDYILSRECQKNVWVKWNLPTVYGQHEVSEFEQSLGVLGNEVEELARGMFPDGYLVERRSEGAQALTQKLVAEHTPVIFQAVFATDKFLAATDVLKWNASAGAYDLYEIKMSSTEDEGEDGKKKVNRKKETQFEYDLTFQYNVLALCGVKVHKKYLVRLNKEYVRQGELDFSRLFILEDKTEVVDMLAEQALAEMNSTYDYLMQSKEPEGHCTCYYKGRSAHCTSFSHTNPDVPAYSVHDLNKIGNSKALLIEFLNEGVLHIADVPLDDRLDPKKPAKGKKPSPPRKRNQVLVHKSQKPLIDHESIERELNSLIYPLYFLDYETSPAPVPPYSGYRPYQQIVFQYSLHVLRSADAEPEHYEELILDGDPAPRIAASMKKHIDPVGSVVVWFKTFENTRNRELASIVPEYADFFHDVIARTYDLMDIVDQQHYVHPDFHGRASIKKVLPVLVPHMSYGDLTIQNGTGAIEAYRKVTKGEVAGLELEKLKEDMLMYCGQDTLAMVRIWQEFRKSIVK